VKSDDCRKEMLAPNSGMRTGCRVMKLKAFATILLLGLGFLTSACEQQTEAEEAGEEMEEAAEEAGEAAEEAAEDVEDAAE